ncbi:MAG TPA: secretin and TonB N-terminal domain-containing protein, partial [Candidatus Wallbacteria bacterium]|nr:secretin and TonB N-terminal domain-containing protein [Candidatus Wallbacteria bacterium]
MRIFNIRIIFIVFSLLFALFQRTAPAFAFDAEFNATPISQVLKIFSKELEMNIMPDPKILDIKVSASLKNMEAESALDLILKMNGLTFSQESENTIAVFKISDIPKYVKLSTHVFKLDGADPENVARTLKILYPRVDFVPNKQQNSIFVAGYFSNGDVSKMRERIAEADQPAPRVRVNFEIIKINNNDLANALAIIKSNPSYSRQTANFVFEDIKTRGSSVTKANLTLMPGASSSIRKTTTVPFTVRDEHGRPAGVAETSAGDMVAVRVISASEDSATLEFAIDTTQFISRGNDNLPPASSGERTRSA